MKALFFGFFGVLRAVPVKFDESSECYSTCKIYFPVEWLSYCMKHYCEEEWNDNNNETGEDNNSFTDSESSYSSETVTVTETTTSSTIATTTSLSFTTTTSSTTSSTLFTTTSTTSFPTEKDYNDPAYAEEYAYYNDVTSTEQPTYTTSTSTVEYNYGYYDDHDWHYDEWDDYWYQSGYHYYDEEAYYGYDTYEWESDSFNWVETTTTPETTTSPEESFTASFFIESNYNSQCGISPPLLSESPEDPGSALISIKDPPTGIQIIEIDSVVINGKDVSDPKLFPWMAALRTNGGFHFCGGAVINERWVLTAAHCEFLVETCVVVTGTLARSNGAGETISKASTVYNHPNADVTPYGTWKFDLTLIHLEKALLFSDYIRPICLPELGQSFVGQACHLAGWGRTDSNPVEYTEQLQQATMRVDSFCGAYEPLLHYDNSFCAGYHQDNSGCNGDSGSPLVCRSGDTFVVAGVTSWASGACHGEEPTGYANVAAHIDWIHDVMDEK